MHFKENNAYIPEVHDDARGILDVNLEAADMSQHVSFYKRFLVESAFLNVQSILRESATIRALAVDSPNGVMMLSTPLLIGYASALPIPNKNMPA